MKNTGQKYLILTSIKKAGIEQSDRSGVIQANSSKYRVDGEIGRFDFTTYRMKGADGFIFDISPEMFHPLASREDYRTEGFEELTFQLASNLSYREQS